MSDRGTGLARVDVDHPEAFAVCDRCGAWRNHSDLTWQYDFRGNALQNLRILVCREGSRCNDRPFEFFRPIIVGPDPIPIRDPRPETFGFDYGLQGFTSYTLWNGGAAPDPYLTGLAADPEGDLIATVEGVAIAAGTLYNQASVLAAIVAITDIPLPADLTDMSITLGPANTAQPLLVDFPARQWLLIYNPTSHPIAIALGADAVLGRRPSVDIGYGGALFWANAQDEQPVYTGAISAVGNFLDQPVWAWEG